MITLRNECPIAQAIARILRVLSSIDFSDELLFSTHKIYDVGSDCLLAHEFEATQPPVTQCEP